MTVRYITSFYSSHILSQLTEKKTLDQMSAAEILREMLSATPVPRCQASLCLCPVQARLVKIYQTALIQKHAQ